MSEQENKTVTENKGASTGSKVKETLAKVKEVCNKPVKTVIGWSVFGGVVALTVALMLICWL